MFKRLFPTRGPEPRLRVLMVCMGNICRSPMAEAALRARLAAAGLAEQVAVDSAGTLASHRGAPPDPRAQDCAARRGLDLKGQRARQVRDDDFARFDLLLAMDEQNLQALQARCPGAQQHKLHLLLAPLHQPDSREVPDPYYGSASAFERALDLIDAGCAAWMPALRARLQDGDVSRSNVD